MINAVIIDDEPLAISVVRDYLSSWETISVVGECLNGYEGLKAIGSLKPDLIFLDIRMPKINGFELLELLDDPLPLVIFTTAFDEYALKAFEVHAVDYLLKPFSKERFDKAMNAMLEHRKQGLPGNNIQEMIGASATGNDEQQRVVVKSGNNIRIIPVQDIVYIEAYDDYVKIIAAGDCFLKKKTMTYYEQTLDAMEFVRVHRSFIVQVSQITRIEPNAKDSHLAILKDGSKIPLSKSGYSRLKEILGL